MRWLAAFIVAATSLLALPAEAQTQRRMALIIGNADYDGDGVVSPDREPAQGLQYDLVNPTNDVAAVARLLGEGFDTPRPILNADFDTMNTALAEFAIAVAEADAAAEAAGRAKPIVVVYYAGHGMEFANTNYLIPVRSRLPAPEEMQNAPAIAARQRLQGRVVSLDDILTLFGQRGDATTLVVIDACRNNPWARRARGSRSSAVDQGLAHVTPVGSLIVALSASPGEVASDGRGQSLSPFAQAFVDVGARRDLSFVDAFSEMVSRVVNATPSRQRPWMVGSPSGRFCLLECAPGAPHRSSPNVAGEPGSLEDWQAWIGDGRIYFEIDRFDLNEDARTALDTQASWLGAYPNVEVTIVGHVANEGLTGGVSREYALGLGQRRAAAVQDYLVERGIARNRITTLSVGRERPLMEGTSAEANARNRHAQVVPYAPSSNVAGLGDLAFAALQRSPVFADLVGATPRPLVAVTYFNNSTDDFRLDTNDVRDRLVAVLVEAGATLTNNLSPDAPRDITISGDVRSSVENGAGGRRRTLTLVLTAIGRDERVLGSWNVSIEQSASGQN